MELQTKEQILNLIAQAQAVYEESILPENREDKGYAFATGYLRSTLKAIQWHIEHEVAQ